MLYVHIHVYMCISSVYQLDISGSSNIAKPDKREVQEGEGEVQYFQSLLSGTVKVSAVVVNVPPLTCIPAIGEEHVLGIAKTLSVCLYNHIHVLYMITAQLITTQDTTQLEEIVG